VSNSVLCVLGGSEAPNSLTWMLLSTNLIPSPPTGVKTFRDAVLRDMEIRCMLYQAGYVCSRHVSGGQYLAVSCSIRDGILTL